MVKITTAYAGCENAITDLVAAVFTASEGAEEGELIGGLAHDLLADTSPADIRVFCADDVGHLVDSGIFTRLRYPEDPHIVFLLGPVAVATERQRQGIGQALLTQALASLRSEDIDIALTYGDPSYYQHVGFRPITEEQARPPLRLSLPHGWLGQSLTGKPMPILQGPSTCVSALNRTEYW